MIGLKAPLLDKRVEIFGVRGDNAFINGARGRAVNFHPADGPPMNHCGKLIQADF